MNTLSMSKQLEPLLRIQEIDIRIATFSAEDRKWQELIANTENKLVLAEEKLAGLKQQRIELQVERDRLQLEADEEQERINNYERRIRDISNTREFQALSREVSVSKKARADAEEAALLTMEKIETLEAEINGLIELRNGIQAELEQQKHGYAGVSEKSSGELAPLQKDREQTAKNIDRKILNHYSTVCKRFTNAVVFAVGETCTGCNRKLPPQLFNLVLRDITLVTCPACKRILMPQLQKSGEPGDPPAAQIAAH